MQMFDRVVVVADLHFAEQALAFRAVLETMRLQTTLVRLVQDRQVPSFFAQHAPHHDLTVLMAHGSGPDDAPRIELSVVAQRDNDHTEVEGWSPTTVDLSAHTVPDIVDGHGRGTLLSLACGSGRPPLPQAFLQQGYDTVIAPTDKYIDLSASLLFAHAFAYALLQDRDHATPRTESEAFDLARAIDAPSTYGPRLMTRYTREELERG